MNANADNVSRYVRARVGRQCKDWEAAEAALTDSARYQSGASISTHLVSSDHIDALERVLVARELGDFGGATSGLQALLRDDGLSNRLRAEAHATLGDLLQLSGAPTDVWLGHHVACLTLHEHHELSLNAVHRARIDDLALAAGLGGEPAGARVVLVLGSNAATVAFANAFMARHQVVGIVQQYAECPAIAPEHRPGDGALPFGLSGSENRYFDDEAVLGNAWNALFVAPSVPMRYVSRGEANSPETLSWVARLGPDLIVSHGPERLGAEFIALAPLGGLNVHWGLSPRYRGMHTSRWALVHGRPECVGVTIHKLDPGLDSGPILYQARPRIEPGDSMRRIEYRLTLLAMSIVPQAVEEVVAGAGQAVEQDLSAGKEYRLREWAEEHEAMLTPDYIADLARAYAADREARDRHAPLINPWTATGDERSDSVY